MVTAYTSTPNRLLRLIKEAMEINKIDTWEYDSDGDFTHVPYQWRNKAWFEPEKHEGEKIIFKIIESKRIPLTKELYGLYHGRFAEMLVTHFSNYIKRIEISPRPTSLDLINRRRDED